MQCVNRTVANATNIMEQQSNSSQEHILHYLQKQIKQIVRRSVQRKQLATQNYFFLMVNYFTKNIYNPAELAVAQFSLQEGLQRIYHTLINPDQDGHESSHVAQEYSRAAHHLPLASKALGNTDLDGIHAELLKFVGLEPVYTVQEQIPIVRKTLKFLNGGVGCQLNVYPIEYLFFTLKKATCTVASLSPPKSINITNQQFNLDPDKYRSGISCPYHEKGYLMQHCAKSYVTRWSFAFARYMCSDLTLKMKLRIPEQISSEKAEPAETPYIKLEPLSDYESGLNADILDTLNNLDLDNIFEEEDILRFNSETFNEASFKKQKYADVGVKSVEDAQAKNEGNPKHMEKDRALSPPPPPIITIEAEYSDIEQNNFKSKEAEHKNRGLSPNTLLESRRAIKSKRKNESYERKHLLSKGRWRSRSRSRERSRNISPKGYYKDRNVSHDRSNSPRHRRSQYSRSTYSPQRANNNKHSRERDRCRHSEQERSPLRCRSRSPNYKRRSKSPTILHRTGSNRWRYSRDTSHPLWSFEGSTHSLVSDAVRDKSSDSSPEHNRNQYSKSIPPIVGINNSASISANGAPQESYIYIERATLTRSIPPISTNRNNYKEPLKQSFVPLSTRKPIPLIYNKHPYGSVMNYQCTPAPVPPAAPVPNYHQPQQPGSYGSLPHPYALRCRLGTEMPNSLQPHDLRHRLQPSSQIAYSREQFHAFQYDNERVSTTNRFQPWRYGYDNTY